MLDLSTEHWLIKSPATDDEWSAYFDLRWKMLRAPWKQAHGSERDEFEETAIHRCALDKHKNIQAIGRLHLLAPQTGQIRYMAVNYSYQRQGLGTRILQSLEAAARQNAYRSIQLHARDTALIFYRQQGYTVLEKSHILYNTIQHYLMRKELSRH